MICRFKLLDTIAHFEHARLGLPQSRIGIPEARLVALRGHMAYFGDGPPEMP